MLMMDQGNVAMSTTYEDHRFQLGYVVTKPIYGSGMKIGFIPEPVFKTESGVTYNNLHNNQMLDTSALLNEDVASQMYQHQLEIDHFLTQHAEKMRSEVNEMQKRSSRRMIMAANEGVMKRLKTKEEEITRLNQVNRSLEEKLKSLLVENQKWRELAQTNEATTYNLQQLLAQAQLQQQEQEQTLVNDDDIDDGESCCSNKVNSNKCLKCGKKESCQQLKVEGDENENVPLHYYITDNIKIQFWREEFCLVTGLRFGVENLADYIDSELSIPFRRRVFPSSLDGEHITGNMVFRIIDDELFDRLYNDDVVSLCCLGILQLVLLGVEDKRRIPDWMLRVVAWKEKGRFMGTLVHGFFHENMPAARLTPDETEARSDWWISSRAYFDGGIDQAERNISNPEKREQRPSIYKRSLYMEQPPSTVLPKKR
nr:hypothetical protein [Tanacetum cinerariifolium]